MLISGVDEAGRGPIIGPMVMAMATYDSKNIVKLSELGVKDSKLLSYAKREELFDKVIELAEDFKIRIIPCKEIDTALASPDLNLNLLELLKTAEMINDTETDEIIIDCPHPRPDSYKFLLKTKLMDDSAKLVVEHKADMNHLVVGAASIIAKVIRDREIEKLKKDYDVDFGSGYLGDKKTYKFLEENFDKYPFFRKSWLPWKKLFEKKAQSDLNSFFE